MDVGQGERRDEDEHELVVVGQEDVVLDVRPEIRVNRQAEAGDGPRPRPAEPDRPSSQQGSGGGGHDPDSQPHDAARFAAEGQQWHRPDGRQGRIVEHLDRQRMAGLDQWAAVEGTVEQIAGGRVIDVPVVEPRIPARDELGVGDHDPRAADQPDRP